MVGFCFFVFLRAKSGPSPPLGFINTTMSKALALIKIPSMPEFAKISRPKQNKLRGKSGNPLYLLLSRGLEGNLACSLFPSFGLMPYIFQGSFFRPHCFLLEELVGF